MNPTSILQKLNKKENWFWGILTLLLLILASIKSYTEGLDTYVYLHASKQLFLGEDIYSHNPYNLYLYSPFFAVLVWPFMILGELGKAAWGVFNMLLFLRLSYIFIQTLLNNISLSKRQKNYLYLGGAILSFGMVLHNVSLGQITILILWLTFEGLFQIFIKGRKIIGSILLGLGVIIKIIPVLALIFLVLKKQIKASFIAGITIVICLFIPTIFVGFHQNTELLKNWEQAINPSKEKYVFEFDNDTYSLNAILPAYFYDFEENNIDPPTSLPRTIFKLSNTQLELLLLIIRIGLVVSLFYFVYYSKKKESDSTSHIYFIWQFSYLALITALIFPHQQKYAMLYFVPSGIYFLLNFIRGIQDNSRDKTAQKVLAYISFILIILFSIQGRDIIGNPATEFLDDYHTFGLINMLAVLLIFLIRPDNSFITKLK